MSVPIDSELGAEGPRRHSMAAATTKCASILYIAFRTAAGGAQARPGGRAGVLLDKGWSRARLHVWEMRRSIRWATSEMFGRGRGRSGGPRSGELARERADRDGAMAGKFLAFR